MRGNVLSLITTRRVLAAFIVWIAFAGLLALSTFSTTAEATHAWKDYHWGRTTPSFTLQLGNNVSGPWGTHLSTASTDWSVSDNLDTTIVSGASNPKRCNPTSGKVEVCNSKYGSNGWLGLASIWISGGHIVQGTAKMNDTYFNTAKYNNAAWRNLVMCQEVGHTLGLGHVNETYNTANEGTCMDYTNDPDGPASNEHPNDHDYGQLTTSYSHTTDTTATYSTTSAASRLPAAARDIDTSDPSQRGQLIHRSARGGVEIYERDFGQGHRVITRVIRVVDGTPALDANGGGGGGHNHADHEH